MINKIIHKPLLHISLILLLSIISYSNTFNVPFVFDDPEVIVNNPIIKDLHYFIQPSEARTFGKYFQYEVFRKRYIGYLSFAINYRIHGLNVTGYHIVNLLIHFVNAIIVYYLVILTLRTPLLKKSSDRQHAWKIAVIAALLFVTHPIQTQAVTYIWQRVTSLASTFYIFSLLMYVKARIHMIVGKRQRAGKGLPSVQTAAFYFLSIASTVLAMKTKEIAFTLPVMIVLYELLLPDGIEMKRLLYLIPFLISLVIIPLSLLGADQSLGDMIGDVSQAASETTNISRADYLFTQFRVLITYLRLIILPVNQNLDYDYPVYHSFFVPDVFLSFLLLISIFTTGVYLMYRYKKRAGCGILIPFGIFWFFITLSVESSIIPIRDVIFEHRMYLPSIGIFIAVGTIMVMTADKLQRRWMVTGRVTVPVFAVLVAVLTITTYARNSVWENEIMLWGDAVSKSPEKARPHSHLGTAYAVTGQYEKAIEHLDKVLTLNPSYALAYINRGIVHAELGNYQEAIKNYENAIEIMPENEKAYYNRGVDYMELGNYQDAIADFTRAIELAPRYVKAFKRRGDIYGMIGNYQGAVNDFSSVIRLDPGAADVYFERGKMYLKLGSHRQAEYDIRTSAQLGYGDALEYLDSRGHGGKESR